MILNYFEPAFWLEKIVRGNNIHKANLIIQHA